MINIVILVLSASDKNRLAAYVNERSSFCIHQCPKKNSINRLYNDSSLYCSS